MTHQVTFHKPETVSELKGLQNLLNFLFERKGTGHGLTRYQVQMQGNYYAYTDINGHEVAKEDSYRFCILRRLCAIIDIKTNRYHIPVKYSIKAFKAFLEELATTKTKDDVINVIIKFSEGSDVIDLGILPADLQKLIVEYFKGYGKSLHEHQLARNRQLDANKIHRKLSRHGFITKTLPKPRK